MRRSVAITMLTLTALVPLLWLEQAGARVTGGSSDGRAGYASPSASTPGWLALRPDLQRADRGGLFSRLFLGGFLGSLLVGATWAGGIGLLDVMVLSGLVYLAFRALDDRKPATPPRYAGWELSGTGRQPSWFRATTQAPPTSVELDRGLRDIRESDPGFDAERFGETATEIFLRIQAAWMVRDMSGSAEVLTPEMLGWFQKDCDQMRAAGRINRLERLRMHETAIVEAGQERGKDYVTVRFRVSVIDYTTDEQGQVLDGSRTEPVARQELWTFVRPIGPHSWKLSAIEPPA